MKKFILRWILPYAIPILIDVLRDLARRLDNDIKPESVENIADNIHIVANGINEKITKIRKS